MDVAYLMLNNYRVYHYKKSEVIYRAGTKPRFVYFIKSGQVKMITFNSEGKEFIQSVFKAGAYFGEPALLLNRNYLANTVATENSEIFKVSHEDFIARIKSDGDFSFSLIMALSDRLFYKSMMLEEVANENAPHKLLTLITHLSENLENGAPLDITRKQLAERSGLRVETVIRTLKELSKNKLITVSKGKIIKS